MHVADTLGTCDSSYHTIKLEKAKIFDTEPRTVDKVAFYSVEIVTEPNGTRFVHQKTFAEKLSSVERDLYFKFFIFHHLELGWITHNLLEVAGDSTLFARVTNESIKRYKFNNAARQ